MKVAVVIPAYNAAATIFDVVTSVWAQAPCVESIYVVDDGSRDDTGHEGTRAARLITHPRNRGVGAATMTGWRRAMQDGYDVLVRMDADRQMDPRYIDRMVGLLEHYALVKGNRLADRARIPRVRRWANRLLSWLYGPDPVNGFFAIHAEVVRELDFRQLSRRWFFECSLMYQLELMGYLVGQVDMPAIYPEGARARSHLPIATLVLTFPFLMLRGLVLRCLR